MKKLIAIGAITIVAAFVLEPVTSFFTFFLSFLF